MAVRDEDDELLARAQERVGSVLRGKYRLDEVLGVGATSAVYAATHLRHANRVAVKVLHRKFTLDSTLRDRFLREGYAANSVGHPGTVRVHDDDMADDGAVFLVLELLDGETIEARWERLGYRLDAAEVVVIVDKLLDVLAAAHTNGIIHRDVKPENLFVTRDGALRVLDFGVARLLDGAATATRSGGILGTPVFMPPEQVLGKTREVDARSDVWSVGATAFTLLSGQYVHEGETPEEVMVFAGSRHARSLAEVAPDLAPALVEVFDRALRFEKSERWASARAMQDALASASREAFGDMLPEHRGDEDDAADKTTVDVDEQTRVMRESDAVRAPVGAEEAPGTVFLAEPEPEGFPAYVQHVSPEGSWWTRAAWQLRHSLLDTVTATTTDDIPRLPAAPIREVRSRAVFFAAAAVSLTATLVGAALYFATRPSVSTPAPAATATDEARASPSIAPPPALETPPVVRPSEALTVDPPTFAVESLPTSPPPSPVIATARPAPPAATSSAPAPVAAPSVALPPVVAPPPHCSPPFDVDPNTGEKKWKLECL